LAEWDKRYGESETRLFGAAPSEYLREVMVRSDVAPTSALLLGDGDGRNGQWLAARCLAVTGIDVSQVATDLAIGHDRAGGFKVERICADLAHWQPDAGRQWDAAVLLYLQCEESVRLIAVARAAAALAPGGVFIAEGFSRAGATDEVTLGPKAPDVLYDLAFLVRSLAGFRILEAFEGETWLAEGPRHAGPAKVVRLLARKQPSTT
jgi:SAM-dependent methyltransferase